jgi:hypothetical protein
MRRSSLLLLGFALLGGCTEPVATGTMSPQDEAAAIKGSSVSENKDLATLHAATARFHQFEAAKDARYTFLFMNMCMVDQSPAKEGGMGYHYVNTDLLDDQLDVANPEALLYEPESNGRLKLVAVEYVIPADAWHHDYAPELFGQKLVLNSFNLWALHVWAWENNPSGIYKSWNPRVNCDNAA